MKTILLATDLEVNSDRAMERALKTTQQQNAKLHIVHAIPKYKKSPLPKMFKKQAEDLIEAVLVDEFPAYKGLDIETEVVISKEPYAEILRYADEIKADLIIMGIHGKTKFQDLFIGTTVERVIRMGHRPVLMVKNKAIVPYDSIVSAIDLAPASRNAMRIAMDLYPKAKFNLVHTYPLPSTGAMAHHYVVQIYQDYKESHEKAMIAFKNTEEKYYAKQHAGAQKNLKINIAEGSPLKEILKISKEKSANLLTIGAHGKSMITPSKLGGVAEDILANPPCDVLVVKE